jgi:hypothetical protein
MPDLTAPERTPASERPGCPICLGVKEHRSGCPHAGLSIAEAQRLHRQDVRTPDNPSSGKKSWRLFRRRGR